jgi:hypothetical protein
MSGNRKTARVGVIGIDIGKNLFRVVAQDQRGAIVLRQKWSRVQVVEARLCHSRLANPRTPEITKLEPQATKRHFQHRRSQLQSPYWRRGPRTR